MYYTSVIVSDRSIAMSIFGLIHLLGMWKIYLATTVVEL